MPSEPPRDADAQQAGPPPVELKPTAGTTPPQVLEPAGATRSDTSQLQSIPVLVPAAGHLHPVTLVLAAWKTIRGFLIPAVAVLVFGRSEKFAGAILFVPLAISMTIAVLRYFTFSYRIQGEELVTREGLLERRERHVPLERVQDIRIEQGVLHRVFGVVDVHVETAGGEGPEASLSVLSRAEAERLRQAVFGHARQAASVAAAAVAASADVAVERQIVRQLSLRELVWAGLTSNRMASALVLAGAVWALVDDVLPENVYEKFAKAAVEEAQLVLQQGTQTAVLLAVLGLAVLFLISVVVSVIGSVVLFYGFTLSRRDEDLHRSYGLLTRRSSSLPRRRLQILEIEEGFLRRLFRLATLRADTAGSAKESEAAGAGRDVLLPIVRREEVEHLLPLFFPDLQPVPTEWRRVSRRAIVRGTLKGSLICVLAAVAAVAWQGDPTGLWPLLLVPLVYGVNVMRYYNLAYAVDASYFRSRRGWLSRSTHIVPIRNAQSVVVRQTPFDRRLGLATLVVDTAGQAFTGGGPRISNLPLEEARQLAHSLAHRAAATRYRW